MFKKIYLYILFLLVGLLPFSLGAYSNESVADLLYKKNISYSTIRILKENNLVNIIDSRKQNLLFHAAIANNYQVAEFLIENGVPVNSLSISKSTPIHQAIRNGSVETAKLLLNNGADLNKQDFSGYTPLMRAVESEQFELFHSSLSYSFDVELQNKRGEDIIDIIVRNNNYQLLSEFLKNAKNLANEYLANKLLKYKDNNKANMILANAYENKKLRADKDLVKVAVWLDNAKIKENSILVENNISKKILLGGDNSQEIAFFDNDVRNNRLDRILNYDANQKNKTNELETKQIKENENVIKKEEALSIVEHERLEGENIKEDAESSEIVNENNNLINNLDELEIVTIETNKNFFFQDDVSYVILTSYYDDTAKETISNPLKLEEIKLSKQNNFFFRSVVTENIYETYSNNPSKENETFAKVQDNKSEQYLLFNIVAKENDSNSELSDENEKKIDLDLTRKLLREKLKGGFAAQDPEDVKQVIFANKITELNFRVKVKPGSDIEYYKLPILTNLQLTYEKSLRLKKKDRNLTIADRDLLYLRYNIEASEIVNSPLITIYSESRTKLPLWLNAKRSAVFISSNDRINQKVQSYNLFNKRNKQNESVVFLGNDNQADINNKTDLRKRKKVSREGVFIQVGSFKNFDKAKKAAFKAKKYGQVFYVDNKSITRVLLGNFKTLEEARKLTATEKFKADFSDFLIINR